MLPNPPNIKSPDSYNHTLGVFQEYKTNATPTQNAIDMAIRSASKQADNIVLELTQKIDFSTLTKSIQSRTRRQNNINSITLIYKDTDCFFDREKILGKDFKIQPSDLQ